MSGPITAQYCVFVLTNHSSVMQCVDQSGPSIHLAGGAEDERGLLVLELLDDVAEGGEVVVQGGVHRHLPAAAVQHQLASGLLVTRNIMD